MDFVDGVLLRLADTESRSALFDQDSLAAVAAAAYDTDALGLEGPYTAAFDEVALTPYLEPSVNVRGTLQQAGGASTDLALVASGLSGHHATSADALWQGAVVARSRRFGDPVTAVAVDWEDDPDRDDQPRAAVEVTFAEPSAVDTTARPLAVSVAILVRPDTASIRELLQASIQLRHDMAELGYGLRHDASHPARRSVLVAWIVPHSILDDDGWPGATPAMTQDAKRAARRARATTSLAPAGVVLVPV